MLLQLPPALQLGILIVFSADPEVQHEPTGVRSPLSGHSQS
jgi:hypothetical protein